jgi:hypothetical protein
VTLQQALAILVRALGDDHPSTQRALKALQSLYTEWGKPGRAAEYAARIHT